MPRTKSSVATHRRHKKVLSLTKGHRASRHKLYRSAHESMIHALRYAYFHRRERKGDFRRLWIARINAAVRERGLTYSQFMGLLKKTGVEVNRKMLSELAVRDPQAFDQLFSQVTADTQVAG